MLHDLTGIWAFRRASDEVSAVSGGETNWTPATVPGCVHLDLMQAGEIPDPFYGTNDLEVQCVSEADWEYRHVFDCPPELLALRRVELVCEGLDTFAEVKLNGETVGQADNMFREWRWDVTGLLRKENNELTVSFESPEARARALWEADKGISRTSYNPGRSYARKAQYAYGWDWGPQLNTCGVWRPIYLQGFDEGRISDVATRVSWSEDGKATVHVAVELEMLEGADLDVVAELTDEDGVRTAERHEQAPAGPATVDLALPVESPQLWWPAGMGEQNLYGLSVTARAGERVLGSRSLSIGLRRIELRREKDEQGESFVFVVNDVPVFCKGANWIPADSFLPRVTPDDYDRLITAARDANMNMLRVWGGGIYEDDVFFDTCDRLGILVWADFMFACAAYPDYLDWFCDSVRAEAEYNVRRLRNHPSLALWCGNNENQWLRPGEPGDILYDEVLPEVCARLDPATPYWPGSPYGGEKPNDHNVGDQHFWDTWAMWRAPEEMLACNGRFISEFGFEAPPALETIRKYVPSSEHHIQSRGMEHHNRNPRGTERLYCYLSRFFRIPGEFDDQVYLMQLMQGEAIKMGVEHWRSRKFDTAGTLFWQHNDCWPVVSWSCIDYAGRPKALYHYTRRFYAPVLPVIKKRDGCYAITVVNDLLDPFTGELVCGYGLLSGDQDWVHKEEITVAANSVAEVLTKPVSELPQGRLEQRYFWCRLLKNHQEVARNAAMPLPFKHVQFGMPDWSVSVEEAGPEELALELTSNTFAKGVWLSVEGEEATFSDNFFDVLAEVETHVTVRTAAPLTPDELKRRLRIRCVADTR